MKHGHGQRAVFSLVISSTTSNAHYEVQREMLGSRGSLRLLAQAMESGPGNFDERTLTTFFDDFDDFDDSDDDFDTMLGLA